MLFPPQSWKLAKSCWQHAGMGVSSRYAERCFTLLDQPKTQFQKISEGYISVHLHLWFLTVHSLTLILQRHSMPTAGAEKRTIRRRIANLISGGPGVPSEVVDEWPDLGNPQGQYVPEDAVFLYPSGMSAIWHAYELVRSLRPGMKSVCFGFVSFLILSFRFNLNLLSDFPTQTHSKFSKSGVQAASSLVTIRTSICPPSKSFSLAQKYLQSPHSSASALRIHFCSPQISRASASLPTIMGF